MLIKKEYRLFVKRVIYIICFVILCLIDQIIGSATGSVQYGLKHNTGIVIAIIMLTAYNPSDFVKIPYFIWVILFLFGRYCILERAFIYSNNYMRLNTFLWNVGIYGVVFIRLFYCLFIEKKRPVMNWFRFVFWLIMIIGMIIIRNDYTWIIPMLLTYFSFYLTEYNEDDLNNLYSGMIDGIIIGFFIIQIQAWMYRPYDRVRYQGMYSHANMNALLYVCVYFAVLAKWYLLKLKQKNVLLRIPWIVLGGLIVSTCIFTGSRTAFVTMGVIVFFFLFVQFLSRKRWKNIEVIVDAVAICLSIVLLFIPSYALIRYGPAYVNLPIYFESDNEETKVQKGDSVDSKKYIELDVALNRMYSRFLWFLDDEDAANVEIWWKDLLEHLNLTIKVQAADLFEGEMIGNTIGCVELGTDQEHPLMQYIEEEEGLNSRLEIYKYFLNKLSLIGEQDNIQGVWLSYDYFATHCHNIYLQFAYDFGIIIGVMFIIVTLFPFIRVLVGLFQKKSGTWYYRLFVTLGFSTILIVFGMLEIDWIYGQLPFTMFWIVQYPVYHKQPFEVQKMLEKKRKKEEASQEKLPEEQESEALEMIEL